ncbi:MAG: hypothetical protein IJG69_02420, partial [Spirochaetales bacterium]|nr:hypothetical protein [Spirochaetales bacterium]
SHCYTLLSVEDEEARLWYMNEASQNGWSTRTLDRNISTLPHVPQPAYALTLRTAD